MNYTNMKCTFADVDKCIYILLSYSKLLSRYQTMRTTQRNSLRSSHSITTPTSPEAASILIFSYHRLDFPLLELHMEKYYMCSFS